MMRSDQVVARNVLHAHRRGDAAKVIIITVCVFAMIMMLLCVGAGVYTYVLFQRNFGRAIVQTPAELQKLTTEITEITIPPQFTPIMGSAIFGMKTVTYTWNPAGKTITLDNWQESQDSTQSMLNLMEMSTDTATGDGDFKIAPREKKVTTQQYTEHKQVVREYEIRGKKCEFLFVTGKPIEGAFEDEMLFDEADEEEMMAEEEGSAKATPAQVEPAKPDDSAPADATKPADASEPVTPTPGTTPVPKTNGPALPAVRTVTGKFPGKSGPTTITIRVPAEGTTLELLEGIIQSIH